MSDHWAMSLYQENTIADHYLVEHMTRSQYRTTDGGHSPEPQTAATVVPTEPQPAATVPSLILTQNHRAPATVCFLNSLNFSRYIWMVSFGPNVAF